MIVPAGEEEADGEGRKREGALDLYYMYKHETQCVILSCACYLVRKVRYADQRCLLRKFMFWLSPFS